MNRLTDPGGWIDGFALVLGARGRFARVVTCAVVVAFAAALACGTPSASYNGPLDCPADPDAGDGGDAGTDGGICLKAAH